MKIVTAAQMRAIEARSEESGVSTDSLMENAGLAVARIARRMVGPLTGVRVVVLIGPGNNGGDGLVTARHLQRWGARATAYLCRDRDADDPKLADAQVAGVRVIQASEDPQLAGLKEALDSAHLVVDAILGTGRARPISGVLEAVLKALSDTRAAKPDSRLLANLCQFSQCCHSERSAAESKNLKTLNGDAYQTDTASLLSLDLPTGLDCDTGEVDPACVASDVTVALGYPKRGHIEFPGASFTGQMEVADIGIPPGLDGDVRLELMTRDWARSALPERPADSHKGTFGRAMIVAGSRNFLGAAHLAATAAGRVGAGLVTIAIPESLVSSVAPSAIEPTFLPLPESSTGIVSDGAATTILESLDGYSALLVGCGLGQAKETRRMVEELLLSGVELPPTIVDADGLNTLSRASKWWERWPSRAVLTPHPGEMSRLTRESDSGSRIDSALESAARWNKTVVLKGAHTVVAHPDGSAMMSPFAIPALATAGTGDVLAGAIVGLLAQGVSLEDAAQLGVYMHALAGEKVSKELGDTGVLASDLLPALPRTIRDLRGGG